MRRFLTSIDKRGNKIPSQNRTGYLSSPPPRPQSGEEIPVASSIPQSIFLHKTRQYFIDIWRSCVSPLRCALGQALSASFGSSETDGEILSAAKDLLCTFVQPPCLTALRISGESPAVKAYTAPFRYGIFNA